MGRQDMDWMTNQIVYNWKELVKTSMEPVMIDYGRLNEVMDEHTPKAAAATSHLPPVPGASSPNPLVAASYLLTGNIWNFHFKTPGHSPYRVANLEDPSRPYEGFMALWHKLYRQFGEQVITADMLRPHLRSTESMAEFFRDMTDIPLPELRWKCGTDYLYGLERYFEGNPLFIIREVASKGSFRAYNEGLGLVEILIRRFTMAYGDDYRTLYGRHFPFYKRARLVAALFQQYAQNSSGDTIIPLEDTDELGPIIDYQIPRIFRALGVLVYSRELETAIEKGVEIQRGSYEEVMIRATAAAAFAHWMERQSIPGWKLDAYLFSISRGLPNKAHYTKTSDY